ncbi:hypothetical protein DQ244_00865 [Blastococcus sp. TBT05-19]|nr:hypothetical protein DQ244_00865 [Blastococcus sp. TBT05-19]
MPVTNGCLLEGKAVERTPVRSKVTSSAVLDCDQEVARTDPAGAGLSIVRPAAEHSAFDATGLGGCDVEADGTDGEGGGAAAGTGAGAGTAGASAWGVPAPSGIPGAPVAEDPKTSVDE